MKYLVILSTLLLSLNLFASDRYITCQIFDAETEVGEFYYSNTDSTACAELKSSSEAICFEGTININVIGAGNSFILTMGSVVKIQDENVKNGEVVGSSGNIYIKEHDKSYEVRCPLQEDKVFEINFG